jgi:hypothetical protein
MAHKFINSRTASCGCDHESPLLVDDGLHGHGI